MTGNNRRGIVLQDRDRQLLTELAVMRIIDREQAKCVAGFGSTTRANTRLLSLVRAGLLRRFFIGTTGRATKALYALSRAGAELVGVPYRGLRRGSEETLVADYFVHHQLSVNELYCLIKCQPLPVADATFSRWLTFYEPIEPGSSLIPDGYAEMSVAARAVPMFIEVDLGTESRAVWKRKVEEYLRYAVSGKFQDAFKQPQFRTLVVASSERRTASLRIATAELTDKIFWFATFQSVTASGFWSALWQRPNDDRRQPLLQIP
jgi:hypothetical protein